MADINVKVHLTINGTTIVLSLEEVKDLKKALDEILSQQPVVNYPTLFRDFEQIKRTPTTPYFTSPSTADPLPDVFYTVATKEE